METHHNAGLWSGSRHRVRCIGVVGGTFGPIHHGYLVAASEMQAAFGLDEVIFVPTPMQPFKLGHTVTLAKHRYLIAVIATASNPKSFVSWVDIERDTTIYTVDTLRDLCGTYQNSGLSLITGADTITDIMERKDVDKLFELAHFVGVTRPGVVLGLGSLPVQRVSLVEIPTMTISPTDRRSKVRSHQPVQYPVSDEVVQYIVKYGPYQDSDFPVSSAKAAEDYGNAGILKFRGEASK